MLAVARKQHFNEMIQVATPDHIFLVRGEDAQTGQRCWYFVQIDRGMRDEFRACSGQPVLTLTDFGTILYCGYGQFPPASIRDLMEKEYGFKS